MPPRTGAFIAMVFWGISFVATKAVLREISPTTLITLRFGVGSAFLLAILLSRGVSIIPPRHSLPSLLLMGFVGVFVHQMLQAFGLTMTSAINTGWLIALTPIWSAILSRLLLGNRFTPLKTLGLVVGFAGALIVITRGELTTDGLFRLPSTLGDLLILASTLNWAIYTVLGHRTIRELGASRATACSVFFGWLMTLPAFLFTRGWNEIAHLTPAGTSALAFLGIACSGLGYLFWYGALEKVEASSVAALLYLEPLVTLIAASLILGESITIPTVVGGLVVLAGVVIVQSSPGGTADSWERVPGSRSAREEP